MRRAWHRRRGRRSVRRGPRNGAGPRVRMRPARPRAARFGLRGNAGISDRSAYRSSLGDVESSPRTARSTARSNRRWKHDLRQRIRWWSGGAAITGGRGERPPIGSRTAGALDVVTTAPDDPKTPSTSWVTPPRLDTGSLRPRRRAVRAVPAPCPPRSVLLFGVSTRQGRPTGVSDDPRDVPRWLIRCPRRADTCNRVKLLGDDHPRPGARSSIPNSAGVLMVDSGQLDRRRPAGSVLGRKGQRGATWDGRRDVHLLRGALRRARTADAVCAQQPRARRLSGCRPDLERAACAARGRRRRGHASERRVRRRQPGKPASAPR